jgi:O-antigen ligase
MIQGQGIIDIVNSYLQIALEFGLVTLFIFVLFFFLIGAKLASRSIKADANAPNYMGALAVLLAMLFTIATTSSVSVIPYLYWTFGGLCAGLTSRRLAQTRTERTERSAPVPTMRVLGGRA